MDIDHANTELVFRFRVGSYFLVRGRDDRFMGKDDPSNLVWTLNPRIDRSYKGKDDDMGMPVLYLSDAEAETCKKAGITYINDYD